MHFKRIHPSRFGMFMRYAIQIHILPFAIRRSVNRHVFCRVLATQGNHWQSLRPKCKRNDSWKMLLA